MNADFVYYKTNNKMPMGTFYFLKSIIASNLMRLPVPFKLSYALTYRCNLRCKMCNIWNKKTALRELSLGEIENFFKKAATISWLGITGGEPFLRDDLPEILRIILRYCRRLYAVHFATNATLLDAIQHSVAVIKKSHKKVNIFFTVSIDGPPALHDSIRGINGTWEKAMKTFIYINQLGKPFRARIGITLSEHNKRTINDTIASIKKVYPAFTLNDITVNVFQRSSFYYDNITMPVLRDEDIIAEIDTLLSIDRDPPTANNILRRLYLQLYKEYLAAKKCPVRCQAFSSTCFVDAHGAIYPCAIYDRSIGNVRDLREKLSVTWNTDRVRAVSAECSNNCCPSCWSPCDAYSAIGGSLLSSFLTAKKYDRVIH